MYEYIDGNLVISVNDWCAAGLTYRQFIDDSQNKRLIIADRRQKGNTMIWVDSIKRPDRMRAIEAALGKANKESAMDTYTITIDTNARAYYSTKDLSAEKQSEYVNKASLFNSVRSIMQTRINALAGCNKRIKMKDFWAEMIVWHTRRCSEYGLKPYSNVRSLERAFKSYCNGGYEALIHGGTGGDNARLVNRRMENLFLGLWRSHDKPFVKRVHELYLDFISGATEFYDRETGEIFNPAEKDANGNAIFVEVSEATVWNYLKDVVNNTAVYADRNGNFDFANKLRPKHHRAKGKYSISKISMDDVALSRKSDRGWVYKYIAVDVVSGYYFRPAYIVGKPTAETVYQSFRNMFCELVELGLPMPGELEVEHHLMKDIPWLDQLFAFTRFCQSPTEKRAEHNIRSLKWGTAKDMGHTRGRWYAKHEAYRSVRNKVDGDYTEPTYHPQTIVADDLADIERHNNELHPLQKTYPGMTRRDVLLKNYNPHLQPIEKSYLYQFIGNETKTSLRNNDYCVAEHSEFEIIDFNALKRLKPNNNDVIAYWLPQEDGSIGKVYLYQDGTYIGEAINRERFAYNECAIERTDADREGMLHQQKRAAKFDMFVKERRAELGNIGKLEAAHAATLDAVEADIVLSENSQPANYEEDEFTCNNYAEMAINNL